MGKQMQARRAVLKMGADVNRYKNNLRLIINWLDHNHPGILATCPWSRGAKAALTRARGQKG